MDLLEPVDPFYLVLRVLGVLAFIFAVFWITRMFWLWYWKIDERIKLMHEQTVLMREIRDSLILNASSKEFKNDQLTPEQKATLYDLKYSYRNTPS